MLYIVRLVSGRFRPVSPTLPDSPLITDYATAVRVRAGHPGSVIEEYHPIESFR